MTYVDTNVILRWLLSDHPELTPKAQTLLSVAEKDEDYLLVTDVVLSEIHYVLRLKGYKNNQVAEAISNLIEQPALVFDQESMLGLLVKIIAETKLDFADCYLIARALFSKKDLETFDQPMLKAYAKYKTRA